MNEFFEKTFVATKWRKRLGNEGHRELTRKKNGTYFYGNTIR